MENTLTQNPVAVQSSRRWPLFILGALFFLLGPAIYTFQIMYQRQLTTP